MIQSPRASGGLGVQHAIFMYLKILYDGLIVVKM